jgi:hypothetical protein
VIESEAPIAAYPVAAAATALLAGSRWAGRINRLLTRLAGTLLVVYALYLAAETVGWVR